MLEYNEITLRKIIIFEGVPHEVLASHVFRKQQRKPVNATKLRNLLTGGVTEVSFQVQDKVEEADITVRKVVFLYKNPKNGEFWFSEEKDRSKRFTIDEKVIGNPAQYLKENSLVDVVIFTDNDDEEKVIGVRLPTKIDLEVTDAPPSIKGNTATGGNKQATLETGATLNVPLFINIGDIVKVNTETGEYVERAEKN
jgi:elongation factor P